MLSAHSMLEMICLCKGWLSELREGTAFPYWKKNPMQFACRVAVNIPGWFEGRLCH